MRERVMGGILLGLAVVALRLAGCGVVSTSVGRKSAPVSATPTATPALAWHQAALPSGFDPQHWGLAKSPVDGHDLWLCAPAQRDDFTIWASHDAAATWAPVGSIIVTTSEQGMCTLVADQGSASALVAVVTWGSGEAGTLRSTSLISSDSGAHWRTLAGEMQLMEVGSEAATTYAILHDATDPAALPSGLVVSVDGLRTWQAINPPNLPVNDSIFQFWLGPAPGELVAASIQNTLWRSDDAGTSWTRLPTPNMQTGLGAWVAGMGNWLFCGWSGTPPQMTITCSADQGKSWQQEPTFSTTQQCASCGKGKSPYTSTQPCIPSAISADGSLLADCPTNGATTTWGDTVPYTLYRLAPNATAWTTLGTAPAAWLTLTATGQLWCWDAQGGRLFVVTLPF